MKINKAVKNLPLEVRRDAIKIVKYLESDFAGIDVIRTVDGKYYFLEINLAPQFAGFTRATGMNVARKIVKQTV